MPKSLPIIEQDDPILAIRRECLALAVRAKCMDDDYEKIVLAAEEFYLWLFRPHFESRDSE